MIYILIRGANIQYFFYMVIFFLFFSANCIILPLLHIFIFIYMIFSGTLIKWYVLHQRALPWRNTNNVYFIWVSEIILQQTRVEQGLSYYYKFIERFPDIFSLANAKEEEVLKLWQGLGYYTRARNMHSAAKQIVETYNGEIPSSYEQILKIKGIGKYTAAAILSFGYNLPYPVVDGNVKRVISRFFAIEKDISLPETERIIYKKLNQIFDIKNPGDFNQAIMEFGALYCKPGIPDCSDCIFTKKCLAYKKNKVSEIPYNPSKTKISQRFFYYIIPIYNGNTYLVKREKKDIWKNMFEFPLIELKEAISVKKLLDTEEFKTLIEKKSFTFISDSNVVVHKLSHQHIHAQFIRLEIKNELENHNFIKVTPAEFSKYPVSRLIEKYLMDEKSMGYEKKKE